MKLIINFILQLTPLYLTILVGYISVRFLKIQKESMATLIMSIITPPVIFLGVYKAPATHEYTLLPFIFAAISSLIALLSYGVAKKIFPSGTTANTLSFISGSSNVGYFGLPAIGMIAGPKSFPILAQFVIGMALFQSTLGIFILTKGKMSVRQALGKTISMPILHAFILGIIFKNFDLKISENLENFLENFKGAYSIMGMMMIGVTLKKVKWTPTNRNFIICAFFSKFILWPLFAFGFVFLDRHFFHLYSPFTQTLFLILSFVPIAANTTSYTIELKVLTEEVTLAVILTTIVGLFLVPIAINYLYSP